MALIAPVTNLNLSLMGDPTVNTIADDVFGLIRVFKPALVTARNVAYMAEDSNQVLRTPSALRAASGATSREDAVFTQITDTLNEYAFGYPIDVAQNTRTYGLEISDTYAARRAARKVMAAIEAQIAGLCNTTTFPVVASGGNSLQAAANWTAAGGTPIQDVAAVRANILARRGVTANVLAMTRTAAVRLAANPEIVARYTGATRDIRPTFAGNRADAERALAAIFEIDQVVLLDAAQNTADAGLAGVFSTIFPSTQVLVGYCPDGVSIQETQLGKTLMLATEASTDLSNITTPVQIGEASIEIDEYYEADRKTKVIRATRTAKGHIRDALCGGLVTAIAP
jgi:hypothetical protein